MRAALLLLLTVSLAGCATLIPITKSAVVLTPEDLSEWVAIPAPDHETRSAATLWHDSWKVVPTQGSVAIFERRHLWFAESSVLRFEPELPYPLLGARQHVVELDGAFIVGFEGHAGGGLRLYSRARTEPVDLHPGNTSGVVRTGSDTVVTFHELNDFGLREGEVRGWRWANATLAPTFSHGLDGDPCSYATRGSDIFVFTPVGLWKVSDANVIRIHALQARACPGSFIVDDAGDVWAGMYGFVLHLKKDGERFTEEWLAKRLVIRPPWVVRRWTD